MSVSFKFANVLPTYAIGSTVGCYHGVNTDSGFPKPGGAALDTSPVASDGSLTFDGLEAGLRYVAAQLQGQDWRFIEFLTESEASSSEYVTEATLQKTVEELEALIAEEGGGGGGGSVSMVFYGENLAKARPAIANVIWVGKGGTPANLVEATDILIDESSVAALEAALAGKQPLDSDLTSIAALATNSFGRELLTKSSAAAVRTYIEAASAGSSGITEAEAKALIESLAQPKDSDLTEIAALTTTSAGRAVLTKASATALREYLEAQKEDADLTSIAALATTSSGRELLTLTISTITKELLEQTSAANWRTKLGLGTAATEAATAFQPKDTDLTEIAALATTASGRELLTLTIATISKELLEQTTAANWRTKLGLGTAAVEAATAFQPKDTDLTEIAALTTTSVGRSLLAIANAAAGRTILEAASTTEAGEKIPKSLVTTKGDIVSASAASTPARQAAGANGTVLSAQSAEANGLKWVANEDIDVYTFSVAAPEASKVIGGFFVRSASGQTMKLIGVRVKTVSGTAKFKLKRTTSGAVTTEPIKEKEATSTAADFTPSAETAADKDYYQLETETVSTPTFLVVSVQIERTRS